MSGSGLLPRAATGLVLGKFLPPHLGHLYLCEFARAQVERLCVVVGAQPPEPVPGALRLSWMRALMPDCEVVLLDRTMPQYPHEHPDFWALWRAALREVAPFEPELLFASEDYGRPLAEVLGARFVPLERRALPVSGTLIRDDPWSGWRWLPRVVRPHYLKRVCVFGPESTGKSTLARQLAERFDTRWVPEYARTLIESQGGTLEEADIPRIAAGQLAAERALARSANRLLFTDTDLLTTTLWAQELFGRCPEPVREAAAAQRFDLTLLCDVDLEWEADPARYRPQGRRDFFVRCQAALEQAGRPYVIVRGEGPARLEAAVAAVEGMLDRPVRALPPTRTLM